MLMVVSTVIDTASIILIVAPLLLPAVEALDLDLIWFGIVTVIGAEIGLLTPPARDIVFRHQIDAERPQHKTVGYFHWRVSFRGNHADRPDGDHLLARPQPRVAIAKRHDYPAVRARRGV